MDGIDIVLKHQLAEIRYRELLDEAARQRQLNEARAPRTLAQRNAIAEARTAIANVLLRTGSWLMPEDACGHPANGGLELRPGR
jgi:hypothetical protein